MDKRYRIESSAGVDLGTYEAESKRAAIEAMWADAGWSPGVVEIDEMRREASHAGDAELALLCAHALAGYEDSIAECLAVIRDTRAIELRVIEVERG